MPFSDWWVPDEPLPADEPERASMFANLKVGPMRAAGGRLVVTERRLIFRPNRFDMTIGIKVWQVTRAQVRGIDRIGPTWNLLDGGLRSRLRVTTQDSIPHLFVVNALERVLGDLHALWPECATAPLPPARTL